MLTFLRGRRTDTRPEENPGLWGHLALLSSSGFPQKGPGEPGRSGRRGTSRGPLADPGMGEAAGSGKPRVGAGGSTVPGLSPALRGRALPRAAPPPARRPRPRPRDPNGLRSLPRGDPRSLQAESSLPRRAAAFSWSGRSFRSRGPGRSRRRCREAEPPRFRSPEPGNTRDTRRRRSGTASACCRPATSRRGDAQGKARGAHPGRARRGRGGPGPTTLVPLTAPTFNFLKRLRRRARKRWLGRAGGRCAKGSVLRCTGEQVGETFPEL